MTQNSLRVLFGTFITLALTACGTAPPSVDYVPPPTAEDSQPAPRGIGVLQLQNKLGMNRPDNDLGFAEKFFDPCALGLPSEGCSKKVMSVVHFQLMCRDSEGTVSSAPVALQPIVAPNISWSVGGLSGSTRTDSHGYGQFLLISGNTVREKRLILRKGAHYVGLTIGEITKVVLPKNWCS